MTQNMHLELPPTSDTEFWNPTGDAVLTKTDLSTVRDTICKECTFSLDAASRTAACRTCGRGFIFSVHDVEIEEDKLFIKSKNLHFKLRK